MLAVFEVLETLCQVWAVLDRKRDQERAQGRILGMDGLPPCQIGHEGLSAPPNRAQRA